MTNRIKVSTSLLAVIAIFCVIAAKTQTTLFAANNGGSPTALGKSIPGRAILTPETTATRSDIAQQSESSVEVLATNLGQQKGNDPQVEALSSAKCEANYILDNAGTVVTGWKDLGNVSGINKKQKCKNKAIQNAHYAKEKLLQYAPVGSPNFFAICNAGKLCVDFDSRVEGKTYTKDGNTCIPVGCTKPNCPWNGYQ